MGQAITILVQFGGCFTPLCPGVVPILTPLVVCIPSSISMKTLPIYLKDSITTWEVLAVSISENKGR